jgi:drug/metabolite transporter (DMT)-like permease
MPSSRDWVFIAGVLVILLFAVAHALPENRDLLSPKERRSRAEDAHLAYVVGILDLLAIVCVLAFRRGLVDHLGLPSALAWMLTPLCLLLIITVSIVTLLDLPGAWWILPWTAFILLVLAYVAVAVGPDLFWQRLTAGTPTAHSDERTALQYSRVFSGPVPAPA